MEYSCSETFGMHNARGLRVKVALGVVAFAQIAFGQMGIEDWVLGLQRTRPEVPVKAVRATGGFASPSVSMANGDAFAEDRAIAADGLPFPLPDDAKWTRLKTPEDEYLSECTFSTPDGHSCRFAVYGQRGCKRAYYWTGMRADAPSGGSALTYDQGTNFVATVLSARGAEVDIRGVRDVLVSAETEITVGGVRVECPFDRFRFVFADDRPGANWEHPCRIVFISEDGASFAVSYASRKPKVRRTTDGQRLWLLPGFRTAGPVGLDEVRNIVYPPLTDEQSPGSAYYAGDVSHSYFVLISGGANAEDNGIRFWADTAFMYSTLTKKYGVAADHINVLMSDGRSSAADACLGVTSAGVPVLVSSPTDLDGDGTVDVDYSASWNNLCTVFNGLKSRLTTQDQLFVFVTSHGSARGTAGASNRDCRASLYSPTDDQYDEDGNFANFTDENIANLTKGIACPVAFAFETCFSGGFIDDLTVTANRMVATACNHYEYSWGTSFTVSGAWTGTGIGKTRSYNHWARPFTSALRGYQPQNVSTSTYPWIEDTSRAVAADSGGDGRVSFAEAATYAKANDAMACTLTTHSSTRCGDSEHPQYGESSTGLGSSFWLLKQTAAAPTAPTLSISTYGTSNANASYIKLTWSGSVGATSYNMYRSTGTSRPASPSARGVTSPFYDYKSTSGLVPGVKYHYWIEAVNSAGSAYSSSDWGNILVSLSLGQSSAAFAAAGGSANVAVTANTSWSASADVSWITFNTASGSGNGTLSYTVAANASSVALSGTITVTAGAGTSYPVSTTISVSQDAKVNGGEYQGLRYSIQGNSYAAITGYSGTQASLTIPETLGGYPVEVIGGGAFMGNETIVDVTLPRTCRAVNTWAFYDCPNLRTVTYTFKNEENFSDDYVYAYDDSFESCPALTAVNVSCDVLIVPYDTTSGTAMVAPFRRGGYVLRGWCASYGSLGSAVDISVGGWTSPNGTVWSYWDSVSLPAVLDAASLTFTTGGDANWYGQSGTTHDGEDAAQSGLIANSQSTWMQTTVTGPGVLSFWWYVSSESVSYDFLEFSIDGVSKGKIGGTSVAWSKCGYSLGAGSHTLKWTYRKDGSVSRGLDAGFVDRVVWNTNVISPTIEEGVGYMGTVYRMTLAKGGAPLYVEKSWLTSSGIDISQGVTSTLMNEIGRNGLPRYQSFLFGLEPETTIPAEEQLKTTISFDAAGGLVVSCSPRRESDLVTYTTFGKPALNSPQWIKVTDGNRASMRFFKTKVELK